MNTGSAVAFLSEHNRHAAPPRGRGVWHVDTPGMRSLRLLFSALHGFTGMLPLAGIRLDSGLSAALLSVEIPEPSLPLFVDIETTPIQALPAPHRFTSRAEKLEAKRRASVGSDVSASREREKRRRKARSQ